MIEKERIRRLNDAPEAKGSYVLYWMQASQRVSYNHALNYAVETANRLKLPVLAVFGLTPRYPGANLRHYTFMLQGLKETFESLQRLGTGAKLEIMEPYEAAIKHSEKAAAAVTDRGYTRVQKEWRKKAAKGIKCAFYEIESDVIVPVEAASIKEEYAAATIRKKIHRQISVFMREVKTLKPKYFYKGKAEVFDAENILKKIKFDTLVKPSAFFTGGYSEAKKRLSEFLKSKLKQYGSLRNEPSKDIQSNLSPYLHFGQIAAQEIAAKTLKAGGKINASFLEELIVRRELACNFVNFNKDYDNYNCLPAWAKKSLEDHENDPREHAYSLLQLEQGKTHDKYWNAAQMEMVITGKMHNYMRMYWGKKVLEWSPSARKAYEYLVYLNDKYELDGRDPNGYAGAAWCFGKHDRPWGEREIFGKVRYMNAKGLERKFDMEAYIKKTLNLQRQLI